MRVLSIDPSGTGTSGICLIDEEEIEFQEIKNPFWEKHLQKVIGLVNERTRQIVVYEDLQWVYGRQAGKDMFNLFRLLGSLESLKYHLPVDIFSVQVDQVKRLKKQIVTAKKVIKPLVYKKFRGWFSREQKISEHQVDAFLVYYLWTKRINELTKKESKAKKINKKKN